MFLLYVANSVQISCVVLFVYFDFAFAPFPIRIELMMMFRLITFLGFTKMLMFAAVIVLSFPTFVLMQLIEKAYIGFVKSKSKFGFVFLLPLLRFQRKEREM